MRTDKLITIIFSVILGIIGLFTIYILGSSFLYDAGIIGGSDEYESLESLLEKQNNSVNEDTVLAIEEDLPPAADSLATENENTIAQQRQQDNTERVIQSPGIAEEAPTDIRTTEVEQPVRTSVPRNTEVSSPSAPVSTGVVSGNGAGRRARYEELKKKFSYGTDATGTGWFIHEIWDDPSLSHNTIMCYVSEKGDIYLASHYYGDSKIEHTQAQVMVNGREYVTEQVAVSSPNFVDGSDGSNVWETVHYRNSKEKAIIDQIVRNAQMPVSITLKGEQDVRFVLGVTEKAALKECKEMAELLSYL